MSIKTKNAGAYADIVGVFHKRAGAYEAVQGVYAKAGGVYGRVDAQQIGGVTIGAAGQSGTLYEGFRLAAGDDFVAASLVTQTDASGKYFPSHRRRGRRAVNSAFDDYYWSSDHTGHQDSNRGVPVEPAQDLLVFENGRAKLKTRLSNATEKAHDWPTSSGYGPNRQNASAAFHSGGSSGVKWPCIIEAKVKIPTPASGGAAMWPAFWAENMLPPWPNTGEWDWEWKDTTQLYANFITGSSGGDTSDAIASTVLTTMNDAQDHVVAIVAEATTLKFYIDGALAATAVRRPTDIVNGPMFWWARHGVGNWSGMSYDPSTWTGKEPVMELDWVRIWTKPTSSDLGFKGVVQTINVDFASSFSATLPSMATLWGGTGYTEWLIVQPFEDLAPGMSQVPETTNFGDWYGQTPASNYAGPTFLTWNKTTRAFAGSSFDRSGRLFAHLIAWDDTNGGVAGVARIVVNVGPRVTLNAQTWTQGAAVTIDLYAACDAGMLTTDGTAKAKTISVTGLPAGLSYNDTTGILSGTPATVSSGSFSVTVTNSVSQSVTTAVSYSVGAAAAGIPAPTLTGSPTLIASWDPENASTVTKTGSLIDSISGADGTSFTLTSSGSNRPTLSTLDSKAAIEFTAASSTYLQAATNLGVAAQCTMVVVAKMKSTSTDVALMDISNGASIGTRDRHMLAFLNTAGAGYQYRHYTATENGGQINGGQVNTTKHLVIGQSRTVASNPNTLLFMDGTATALTAAALGSDLSGLTHTTLGARRASGANGLFADAYIQRVLVYASGALDATQREEIATWAASNYGTANNA